MGSFRSYCLFLLCWTTPLAAENLTQVYRLAVQNDPTLQQAYAVMQANDQALPLAISQMVPNISASYQTTGTQSSQAIQNPFVENGGFNSQSYGITLTQPIYHPEHWSQLERSIHIVKGAEATYLSSAQTLIVEVAGQYFKILGSIDDLDYAKGQVKAFSREYEQAKQRFDVGLIAITDVETAKARYDNAVATEISANNEVANQYEHLREIVGRPIKEVAIFPISKSLPLLPPTPNQQEKWVETSHLYNLNVIAAKENATQLKAAIGTQAAGHFPKVDVQGNLQRQKTPAPFSDLVYSKSVSLNVSVPIFSGGSVVFRTREAAARYDEAMQILEEARRDADGNTREAFRGVLTAISRVQALAQAVVSSESSLKATKAAYEVGTRTIVDVLNAETQLLNAQREHSKARYDYLMQGLILKQQAGTLVSDDLYAVCALITDKSAV